MGGGVLPYVGNIGIYGPKGYGFSAVLHSSHDLGMFF